MLKRLMVIVLLLVLLCLVPVTADPAIDVSVSGTIDNMPFTPGQTSTNSSGIELSITTSGITTGWSVEVSDLSDDGKPPSYAGRLVEWDGSQYVTPNPHVLGTNLTVTGYGETDMNNSTAVLGPIGGIIESGSTNNTWSGIPIIIKQYVDYNDLHLTGGNVYKTTITFKGTAT